MPVVSMFYGIVVLMCYFANKKHPEAVISIPDGGILEGALRTAKLKLVQAWIEIHQEELMMGLESGSYRTGNFSNRASEIGRSEMKKVVAVKANEDFSLELKFNDNTVRRFDATPYLDFGVFNELKDINYFRQVRIAYGTVQWPHEQDISPDTLYIESRPIENFNDSTVTERMPN